MRATGVVLGNMYYARNTRLAYKYEQTVNNYQILSLCLCAYVQFSLLVSLFQHLRPAKPT